MADLSLEIGNRPSSTDWRDAHTWRKVDGWEALADPATWETPAEWADLKHPAFNPDADARGRTLAWLVSEHWSAAGVRPALTWGDEGPRPTVALDGLATRGRGAAMLDGPSLFGVLTCQLAAAVTAAEGVARCRWCHKAFPRELGRGRGRPIEFCSEKCKHEREKARKSESERRRYRERKTIGATDRRPPADGNSDGNR